MPHNALTIAYNGIANRILIEVSVTNDKGDSKEFNGLIDTGATNTCVSKELAQELKLISVGETEQKTASGKHNVSIYIADLSLCKGQVVFKKHKVIEANLTEQPGVDMLIGMDILCCGDLAISHKDGKTMASFRIPSVASYNFVTQSESFNKFEAERLKRENNRSKRKR